MKSDREGELDARKKYGVEPIEHGRSGSEMRSKARAACRARYALIPQSHFLPPVPSCAEMHWTSSLLIRMQLCEIG